MAKGTVAAAVSTASGSEIPMRDESALDLQPNLTGGPAVGTDQAISDEAKMHAAELAETAGKVGKPLDIFQRVSSYRAIKARKAAAKARNLANVVVDITPAPAPVTV